MAGMRIPIEFMPMRFSMATFVWKYVYQSNEHAIAELSIREDPYSAVEDDNLWEQKYWRANTGIVNTDKIILALRV